MGLNWFELNYLWWIAIVTLENLEESLGWLRGGGKGVVGISEMLPEIRGCCQESCKNPPHDSVRLRGSLPILADPWQSWDIVNQLS